jgi:hypothetical protein
VISEKEIVSCELGKLLTCLDTHLLSRSNRRERLYGTRAGPRDSDEIAAQRHKTIAARVLQTIGPKIILSLRRGDLLSQCRGTSGKES